MSTKTATTANNDNDVLAEFALQLFERSRELQKQRSGLLSNRDAMKMASFQAFAKGVDDINNVFAFTKLFAGDSADEQIRSMLDYASAACTSNKEASSIMEGMLEKLGNSAAPAAPDAEQKDHDYDDSKLI